MEVDALLARTGARKVDVIAHSMGTISARYYVEHLGGAAKVDAFVSLAGVNQGTLWAVGCAVLVSCREMVPGSSLLDRLSANVEVDRPTRFAAWWSPCDPAILPPTNAELPGARNTETGCLGHSDLKTDSRVVSGVLAFVARPHVRVAHRLSAPSAVSLGRRPRSRAPEVPSAGGRRRNLRRSRPRGGVLLAIIVTAS